MSTQQQQQQGVCGLVISWDLRHGSHPTQQLTHRVPETEAWYEADSPMLAATGAVGVPVHASEAAKADGALTCCSILFNV